MCKKGTEKGDDPKERNHCTAAELSVNAGGSSETTSGALKKGERKIGIASSNSAYMH